MIDSSAIINNGFIFSLDFSNHPIMKKSQFMRELYYFTLEYVSKKYSESNYTCERLFQYKNTLQAEGGYNSSSETLKTHLIQFAIDQIYNVMNYGGIILIIHDLFMILPNEDDFRLAVFYLSEKLENRKIDSGNHYMSLMRHWGDTLFLSSCRKEYGIEYQSLVTQKNYCWLKKSIKRIIITATMSAGKSTLINALVGKRVTRTSQAACTGDISYLYNKPFEDGKIHMYYNDLSLDVSQEELLKDEWNGKRQIATYFRSPRCENKRFCLIDTPGVNTYTHGDHAEITYRALLDEKYDTCVCVLNGRSLGTTDEWRHLQWLRAHVPEGKMVFVVNMLDLYDLEDDSIEETLEDVRYNLKKLDYGAFHICPISAKCAYYSKMKQYDNSLTKREEIDYRTMVKSFDCFEYDLSRYYDESTENHTGTKELNLRKKCGFEGFERILFGG